MAYTSGVAAVSSVMMQMDQCCDIRVEVMVSVTDLGNYLFVWKVELERKEGEVKENRYHLCP